jgi:O-antigen ligase
MDSLQVLRNEFLSQTNKLRMLGFIGGIPLAIQVDRKEILALYLLLFIPLSLAIINFRSVLNTRLTLIDKVTGMYFLWGLLGFCIYLVQILLSGGDGILTRAACVVGTLAYAVLPFVIGRLISRSDSQTESVLEGLVAGMILSCGYLLANYAIQWSVDEFMARYEIGQRMPMVIGFLTILSLSRKQSLLVHFAIVFLAVGLVCFSETRTSIGAFAISFVLTILACGKAYGKNKVLVVMLAALLAAGLATQISVGLRFRINLLAMTAEEAGNKEERKFEELMKKDLPGSVESTVEMSKEDHLIDASLDMRLQIWENLFGKVIDSPQHAIFGYGQLGPSYIGDPLKYSSGYVVRQYSAHNEYLDIVVRTGFVGLALYLLVFGAVLASAWNNNNSSAGSAGWMYFHLTFALLGVAVYGMFHETTRYPWFGLLFWLFAGMLSARNAAQSKAANDAVQNERLAVSNP